MRFCALEGEAPFALKSLPGSAWEGALFEETEEGAAALRAVIAAVAGQFVSVGFARAFHCLSLSARLGCCGTPRSMHGLASTTQPTVLRMVRRVWRSGRTQRLC